MSRSRTITIAASALLVALAIATYLLVMAIPVEAVLGTKIRLPIFHGAMTWVNIAGFTLLGLTALLHIVTRRDGFYAWEFGFRAIAVPLWIAGSGLGLMSAINTWDFSASTQSPVAVAMQDPRLMAQFYIMIGGGVLLALMLLLDTRLLKSVADLVFVVGAWLLLADLFLDPVKKSLHPDSPVLNSDSMAIKGTFFGIVGSLLLMELVAVWLVRRTVTPVTQLLADSAD